jgi:hypothetical protein
VERYQTLAETVKLAKILTTKSVTKQCNSSAAMKNTQTNREKRIHGITVDINSVKMLNAKQGIMAETE